MPKLIVVISGRKRSGKDTFGNQVASLYLNHVHGDGDGMTFMVSEQSGDLFRQTHDSEDFWAFTPHKLELHTVYFADPIKQFCIDVLGLKYTQCYGSESQKNELTHLLWDALPLHIRLENCKPVQGSLGPWYAPRSGQMTGREVMQVFGDLIRDWYPEAWIKYAVGQIQSSPAPLVIVPDARTPQEVRALKALASESTRVWCVRLLRNPCPDQHRTEVALNTFPESEYDLVLPDCNGVHAQGTLMRAPTIEVLRQAGLISV